MALHLTALVIYLTSLGVVHVVSAGRGGQLPCGQCRLHVGARSELSRRLHLRQASFGALATIHRAPTPSLVASSIETSAAGSSLLLLERRTSRPSVLAVH